MIPGERYTSIHSTLCSPTLTEDDQQPSSLLPHNNSNYELVVVLITMILIGSAMVGLALKRLQDNERHNKSTTYRTIDFLFCKWLILCSVEILELISI